VGKNQLTPHTAIQHRNRGSNIHHRRRTSMAKYSSHPRGTRSSSLSDIAVLSVDIFFLSLGTRPSLCLCFDYRNKIGRSPKLKPAEISWLMKLLPQFGVVQAAS